MQQLQLQYKTAFIQPFIQNCTSSYEHFFLIDDEKHNDSAASQERRRWQPGSSSTDDTCSYFVRVVQSSSLTSDVFVSNEGTLDGGILNRTTPLPRDWFEKYLHRAPPSVQTTASPNCRYGRLHCRQAHLAHNRAARHNYSTILPVHG